jgi:hypothetical protein
MGNNSLNKKGEPTGFRRLFVGKVPLGFGWGHIRCCGNGGLGFRPYGGSLQSLRSASVVDGAIPDQDQKQEQEHGGLVADLSGRSKSTATHLCLMQCDPNVGAGLLANTVCQSIHLSLTHRLREQARSHNLTEFGVQTSVLCFSVGAGLPAMQAPRCVKYTGLMPSQASQLPQLVEFSFQNQVGCQAA